MKSEVRSAKPEKNSILNFPSKSGMSLIEILIGTSIMSVCLLGLVATFHFYTQTASANIRTIQATLLVEEGIEAFKFMRDLGWASNISSLTASSTYYLGWNGTRWAATSTNAFIDDTFERKFSVFNVYRNATDDISGSGTFDANSKKLTMTVSWQTAKGTSSKAISTYLTNLWSN